MKAALWLRVSTTEQDERNQLPALEKFAAHHGHEVTPRYELEDSAWQAKDNGEYRAALKRAMDDAWRGEFSVIIVWALDRITREGAEGALRIIRQFRERGCMVRQRPGELAERVGRGAGRAGGVRRLDGRAGVAAAK